MFRTRGILLGLATLGLALLILGQVGADAPSGVHPTASAFQSDARRDHFIELEDGRRLAQIDVELGEDEHGVWLAVRIDAFGPDVEPQPGLAGVPGTNRTTAEELDRLQARGALSARIVSDDGTVTRVAVVSRATRTVPIRRLEADGRIDFHAATDARYTTVIGAEASGLRHGAHRFELRVDGEVRLVGSFEAWPGGGRLGRFAAAGGLHRTRRAGAGGAR